MLGAARRSLKRPEQTPPRTASAGPGTCGWAERMSKQKETSLWCQHSSAPALPTHTTKERDKLNTKRRHTTTQHWRSHRTSGPPARSVDNPTKEALSLLSQKLLVHTLIDTSFAHPAVLPLPLTQQHQLHGVLIQHHLPRRKQHGRALQMQPNQY